MGRELEIEGLSALSGAKENRQPIDSWFARRRRQGFQQIFGDDQIGLVATWLVAAGSISSLYAPSVGRSDHWRGGEGEALMMSLQMAVSSQKSSS
jgi:hypothetical protein